MTGKLEVVRPNGEHVVLYEPYPHFGCKICDAAEAAGTYDPRKATQRKFHASNVPNLLALGTRGTGKSLQLRSDAILRCLQWERFPALILRRTMPDLRKALALDTPIPTPTGWTTMGELLPGRVVFAPDGTSTTVQWKSDATVDPNGTFHITFDNGESIIASAGHQWRVSTRMQRRIGTSRVLTTLDISRSVRAEQDRRCNYAIQRASAWQTPDVDLPIDPYVLGVWLGDGTRGQGAITSHDDEIVDIVRAAGYDVIERPAHYREFSVRGLMDQLRELGVLHYKHVPEIYEQGSFDQRLSLLQGLMDTDGWCREDKWVAFSQTNERREIAESVFRLTASLGLKPRWSERPARLEGKDCGTSYEVGWSGDLPVFRLARKAVRLQPSSRGSHTLWHYIVSCEQVADAPCQCISVDHPSHQFLAGRASIPTHNSHLNFIPYEMEMLGGEFLSTTNIARFDNKSYIQFSQCENIKDVFNYLGSQWGFIGFDELSTWPLDVFLQIAAAARSALDSPYSSVVRASSNTLGIGSDWMERWFITHDVRIEDFPDYNPDEYQSFFSTLKENPHLDRKQYIARLRNLPDHIRRSWLLGEFVREGSYFSDFHPRQVVASVENADGETQTIETMPWHVIDDLPTLVDARTKTEQPILNFPWLNIYRAIDWGYFPDPAVCLWVAVLPSKHAIVFKERSWIRTLAPAVAADIKRESAGMKIADTFCDSSMFLKHGETEFSIGEIMEQHGVPLTPSISDRALLGYAIHQYLNTVIDGRPQIQILKAQGALGCKELIRTIPQIRMGSPDASKMAAGDDHHVICLAYFCAGSAPPSHDPVVSEIPRWMQPIRQRPRPYA